MGDLNRRLSKDEANAYAELYDVCAKRLFAYVVALLGSQQQAADVVQEPFLRLARSNSSRLPIPWLTRSLSPETHCRQKHGRQKRDEPLVDAPCVRARASCHRTTSAHTEAQRSNMVRVRGPGFRLLLAVSDLGAHPAFLTSDLAPPFTSSLRTHSGSPHLISYLH